MLDKDGDMWELGKETIGAEDNGNEVDGVWYVTGQSWLQRCVKS